MSKNEEHKPAVTPGESQEPTERPIGRWPALDPRAISKLQRAGGADLVAKLAVLYLEEAPGRISALRACDSDTERVRLAHGFKTNCRMLGAETMARLCQRMVEAAEAGGRTAGPVGGSGAVDFDGLVDALETAYVDVRDGVEQLRDAARRGGTQD